MVLQVRRWLLIILVPLLFITGCASTDAELQFAALDSPNFTVYYTEKDESAAQDVLAELEANGRRIIDDLHPVKTGKYAIRIYPDLKTFHRAMDMPEAPDGVVGAAWSDSEMRMVSPANPGPTKSYQSMLQVAVHEFAHCVTARLAAENDSSACIWLWESISLYEARQERSLSDLPYMQTGGFPRFLDFTDAMQSSDIYQLGYTVGDYVVQNWGWKGIRDLVLNGGDVTRALGVTEDEFYAGWYGFARVK